MRDDGRDDPYARERARQAARRTRERDADFDPRPPSDTDWTVADGSALSRVAGPSALPELLGRLVTRSGWQQRLESLAIHDRWTEIVGEQLAARCVPVRLAGGTLLIRAESQVWATQLRYMLTALTARANEVLGADKVTSINLTVGPLDGDDA